MKTEPADRHDTILAAALEVFLRYGFAKTSMKDLAQAAGLSRQGLYLHFGSKESIFDAMVAENLRNAGDAVRQALRRADCSVEDRLTEAFEVAHAAGIGSTSLDELIEESRKRCPVAVGAFDTALLTEVAEALSVARVADRWKAEKLSAAELAQHLVHASVGIKHEAASRDGYRAGIRLAVQIICRSPHG
ncbi:TetR/AcrR family transcriptional regulator [Sphingomonas melonis]|uniref:TetR/AcrR family transcriptional regulator n=1 Tax=Sphingomonas melonis TaxID=152682 RepID=UPI00037D7F91|nr:TetR/AcrR family transcriptional regulator [Sphingomonas melonis]